MITLEEMIYINNAYQDLLTKRDEIKRKMADLEDKGLTVARPYWIRRNDPGGKPDQLELTHATGSQYYHQHNTRREYIGVKPEKIKAALAGIKRHAKYIDLDHELRHLNHKINTIEANFRNLRINTLGKQKSF